MTAAETTEVRCSLCRALLCDSPLPSTASVAQIKRWAVDHAFHLAGGDIICRYCLTDIGKTSIETSQPDVDPPAPDFPPPGGTQWMQCATVRPKAREAWLEQASWAMRNHLKAPAEPAPCRQWMLIRPSDHDVRCIMTPRCPGVLNPKPAKTP